MVDEDLRAWHAGVSSWEGNTDVNSRSIGIEIHNPGHADGYPDFPSAQMASVVALSRDIIARHNINDRRVLGHSDVAPGRKVDPGEKFDWRHLHAQGVGHWVQPAPIRPGPVVCRGDTGHDVTTLQAQLRQYGYGLEVSGTYDRATATVVAAFQRHFRPALVDGVADLSTRETLLRLLDE